MDVFGQELSNWLESAEAAGWGEEPMPGFAARDREQATSAGPRREEGPEARLGAYLDALATAPVGVRRAAAEGLVTAARPGDGPWLLAALAQAPEGARFALARALGKAGEAEALNPLLGLLADPFAQREAAEAAVEVALRTGQMAAALSGLAEPGLGAPWRWSARAALADGSWARALQAEWGRLSPPFRLQALEAALRLPADLRAAVKAVSADASGQARSLWESL
jgi:hypothetical protein